MTEAEQVAAYADRALDLGAATLPEEYFYGHLPLCVIDAVYSIGVRYDSVRMVVSRYCEAFGLGRLRTDRDCLPARATQEPMSAFCEKTGQLGPDHMAVAVYENRQRTSSRGGILKADAVHRFATVLRDHGVECFQDLRQAASSPSFESQIRAIPGQASGISLQYFWMLAGADDLVKPDRMVLRFLESALGRVVALDQAQELLQGATAILRTRCSHLTPRLLDYEVWRYQRNVRPTE